MATEPLSTERRDRLVVLDRELNPAVLANLGSLAALPKWAVGPAPVDRSPLVPALYGTESVFRNS